MHSHVHYLHVAREAAVTLNATYQHSQNLVQNCNYMSAGHLDQLDHSCVHAALGQRISELLPEWWG